MISSQFNTPSGIPHYQLAVGGMDAKRTEAKESWEQVLIHHRGSSSSPAFLMQAASECVTADARSPPGAQQRLKRLEFGMSKQSLFFRCPF